jgi:hypothetical protein
MAEGYSHTCVTSSLRHLRVPAGRVSAVVDRPVSALLWCLIRHPHLQNLLRTAASLPGPKVSLTPLTRLPPTTTAEAAPETTGPDAAARAEIARLRGMVAVTLAALARTIDRHLGPAIEGARRAWEKIDDLAMVDSVLAANVSETRRALYRAATTPACRAVGAVATEGLLALDAACGLTGLAERRLSSFIRLRAGSADPTLLPEGRPFLDIGRAIAEVAREWS